MRKGNHFSGQLKIAVLDDHSKKQKMPKKKEKNAMKKDKSDYQQFKDISSRAALGKRQQNLGQVMKLFFFFFSQNKMLSQASQPRNCLHLRQILPQQTILTSTLIAGKVELNEPKEAKIVGLQDCPAKRASKT